MLIEYIEIGKPSYRILVWDIRVEEVKNQPLLRERERERERTCKKKTKTGRGHGLMGLTFVGLQQNGTGSQFFLSLKFELQHFNQMS